MPSAKWNQVVNWSFAPELINGGVCSGLPLIEEPPVYRSGGPLT